MNKKRYISFILSLLIVLSSIMVYPLQASADAAAISKLSAYKQYFRRTIGSLARADMYKNDVLASLTISQAILESGWGESPFGTVGKNLFCIKAYTTWSGLVFDNKENIVYNNMTDYRIMSGTSYRGSSWRGYLTWEDSVADHSTLLKSSTYAGIPGLRDYKQACLKVVECGYTADEGYATRLISIIETYDLLQYDNITPNKQGVIALEMSSAEQKMKPGTTVSLSAKIYSKTTVSEKPVWASANDAVATVSQDGVVTAKAQGTTLITATIGDREACCIVTVSDTAAGYNATSLDNLNVRKEPSTSSTSLGKFAKGQGINVISGPVNGWYQVCGIVESGASVTGWSSAAYIAMITQGDDIKVSKVGLNRFEINRDINNTYKLAYAVGSAFATDKTLTWTSSDPTIASVKDGLITTHKYGTAVITATAKSGVSASCTVNVTTKTVRYNAITTTALYARSDDSETAKSNGIFAEGTQIVVTDNYKNADGLIDDSWYYCEGLMRDGTEGAGCSKADYIVILGKAGETSYPKEFKFVSTAVAIKSGCLYGVIPDSTVGDFLGYVSNPNAYVFNKSGKQLTNEDPITTGCVIKLIDGETVTNSATVIIRGDINANGKIDASDYLILKKYLMKTATLDDISTKAACVAGNSNISVIDYIMIKRHFLGTYVINQNTAG